MTKIVFLLAALVLLTFGKTAGATGCGVRSFANYGVSYNAGFYGQTYTPAIVLPVLAHNNLISTGEAVVINQTLVNAPYTNTIAYVRTPYGLRAVVQQNYAVNQIAKTPVVNVIQTNSKPASTVTKAAKPYDGGPKGAKPPKKSVSPPMKSAVSNAGDTIQRIDGKVFRVNSNGDLLPLNDESK